MFTFLLVVHFLIAVGLVGVILVQRSEGGGLTGGGSPAGLMSARGAADFLTRMTAILATAFVALSILLAVLAAMRHATTIDTSVNRTAPVTAPVTAPQPATGGAAGAAAGSGNLSFGTPLTPEQNGAAAQGTATPRK